MNLLMKDMAPLERYKWMIQTIVPRPIAWVLTKNSAKDEGCNLAPFSYFNALHSHPPLVIMSIGNKDRDTQKDSRRNIEEQKTFIIHIPSTEHAQLVTESSLPLPYGESEIKRCGLNIVYDWQSTKEWPRLRDAKVSFLCSHEQTIEVGKNKQGLIIAEIEEMHLDDEIIKKGKPSVDMKAFDPLARLGGDDYASLGEVFSIKRPDYSPQ